LDSNKDDNVQFLRDVAERTLIISRNISKQKGITYPP